MNINKIFKTFGCCIFPRYFYVTSDMCHGQLSCDTIAACDCLLWFPLLATDWLLGMYDPSPEITPTSVACVCRNGEDDGRRDLVKSWNKME